ncbi:unnamed protein product, partial [Durusdinium trenchii]
VYPEKLRAAILKAYSQSINVAHVETVSSESMLAENHRLNYIIDTEFRALKSLQPEILAYRKYRPTTPPRSSHMERIKKPMNQTDQETKRMIWNHHTKGNMKKAKLRKYLNNNYHFIHVFRWNAFCTEHTLVWDTRPQIDLSGSLGLLSGDDGHRGQQPEAKVGDLSVERAMKLRKAAAHAFIEADASNSLRRAVASGPRPILEYDIGEIVYFFRMGADKKLKFKPCYWHGPARIIMIDQPSTIWLSYQSQLVKASPERIRRPSLEENMALSGWLEDLVQLKKDIVTEPIRGFLDLSDQPLPEILDDEANNEEYTPTEPDETPDQNIPMEPALLPGLQEPMGYPRPLKRYREKGPQDNLVDDDGQSPQPEPDDERPGEPQRDEEAKARHVMKGFSEEGAENIEATTPQ